MDEKSLKIGKDILTIMQLKIEVYELQMNLTKLMDTIFDIQVKIIDLAKEYRITKEKNG
jgi:hypothetical protein